MIGGTVFITSILSYNWYKEIVNNFKIRIKSAVVCASYMLPLDKIKKELSDEHPRITISNEFYKSIQKELKISDIYILKDVPPKVKKYFRIHESPNKVVLFTPAYTHKNKVISVIIPLHDNGAVIGYMGAEISTAPINNKIQKDLLIIIIGSIIMIICMIFSLLIIAKKIVKPIKKINNSALSIAAGQYGERITVQGPKELKDLSLTLNTMSECLLENINRLKENSLIREKTYGEYECAMLLQNHMLQKVIDECQSDNFIIKPISLYSAEPKGLLLDFPKISSGKTEIKLLEAQEAGFEEMYSLLTEYRLCQKNDGKVLNEDYPSLKISIDKPSNILKFFPHNFPSPFIWLNKEKKFVSRNNLKLDPGNFIIIYNRGLLTFFQNNQQLKDFFTRIFKFFADEGLITCTEMIQKELLIVTKRKNIEKDIHLLCLQILY